jgi:hypothetical protein
MSEAKNHFRPLNATHARRADALPAGTPAWITPALASKTIQTWQPFYEKLLTVDDAVTILTSVGKLFEVFSRDG